MQTTEACRAGDPRWLFWSCRGPFEARCVLVSRDRWLGCWNPCTPVAT